MKVIEMEMQNWKIQFNWIKAHAGHQGNELADRLSKEAAINGDLDECYKRIPKSIVINELRDFSVTKWQSEWDHTTKSAITKSFFPKIADRLKIKTNVTPNFSTMVRRHGNIKSYLHKYKTLDSPMCSCKTGEQTVDHIYDCKLFEQQRGSLNLQYYGQKNSP